MALSLDRKAFIDTLSDGQGNVGGVMQPPPEGVWGMPPEILQTLPAYNPDVAKNRVEARNIMEQLGYGPDNRLKIKVSARNTPFYHNPAVILIDELKEAYIGDGIPRPCRPVRWRFCRPRGSVLRGAAVDQSRSGRLELPLRRQQKFPPRGPSVATIALPSPFFVLLHVPSDRCDPTPRHSGQLEVGRGCDHRPPNQPNGSTPRSGPGRNKRLSLAGLRLTYA
jgi:hypothetical protein